MKRLLPFLLLAFLSEAEAACSVQTEIVDQGTGFIVLTGTCTADNDILIETTGSREYDACFLASTAGSADVDVTMDSSTWFPAISLKDEHATDGSEVVATTALKVYSFLSKFLGLRVRQAGATGTTVLMTCWDYE